MDEVAEGTHWDVLIERLQAHRESVGSPSYGEIADRIKQDRMDRGAPDYAAHIARSSVYDAFRMGRSRVNVPLVREIAQALGAKPEQVDVWIRACDKPMPDLSAEAEPAFVMTPRFVLLVMTGCLAFNLIGRVIVDVLPFALYLDMWGTAIAAILLGPWRGAAVGATTNVVGMLISTWVSLPFAIVNVVGALIWGYGVHKYGMGRTLPRFFRLNVIVAVASSCLAVPILFFIFGEGLRESDNAMIQAFLDLGLGLFGSVSLANLISSTADKLLSGFVALVAITMLPWTMRNRLPVVLADHR